ncbi:MAG: AzlC family ABC transporter permease [Pseudomonadota bacterium]
MTDQTYYQTRFSLDGIRRGAIRLLPVSIFVFPFGIAFGVAALERGMTLDQAMTMSLFMFAGASQFAALELWSSPLPWISMALVVLAVNARHLILGAAMSPYVNTLSKGDWFFSLMLISDTNFADTYGAFKEGERDAGLILGGGLMLWAVWAVGTLIGAVAGAAFGNLDRFGVDVVMAGFFAALVAGSVNRPRNLAPILAACTVALATLPVLPTGWNIIAASLAGGVVGAFYSERG